MAAIDEIVKGILDMPWKGEGLDAMALKSMLAAISGGLLLDPAGWITEYCMPCMLPEDGAAPANACMALGSIAEVMASWFAGSILELPSASMIEPSLVIDS